MKNPSREWNIEITGEQLGLTCGILATFFLLPVSLLAIRIIRKETKKNDSNLEICVLKPLC